MKRILLAAIPIGLCLVAGATIAGAQGAPGGGHSNADTVSTQPLSLSLMTGYALASDPQQAAPQNGKGTAVVPVSAPAVGSGTADPSSPDPSGVAVASPGSSNTPGTPRPSRSAAAPGQPQSSSPVIVDSPTSQVPVVDSPTPAPSSSDPVDSPTPAPSSSDPVDSPTPAPSSDDSGSSTP